MHRCMFENIPAYCEHRIKRYTHSHHSIDFLFLFNITTYLITRDYRHRQKWYDKGIGLPNAVNRSSNGLRGMHIFRHLLNSLTYRLTSQGRMGSAMVA